MMTTIIFVIISIIIFELTAYSSAKLMCIFEDRIENTIMCKIPEYSPVLNILNTEVEIGGLYKNQRPTELRIKRCKLIYIFKDFFENLKSIERLDLSDNLIDSLEDGVFDHLQELRFLNMAGNSISSIDSNVFRPLTKLQRLDLSNNFLSDSSFNALSSLKSVKFLDLSGNYQINQFNNLLAGLNLKSLKIRHTSSVVPALYDIYMPNLIYLDLSHNVELYKKRVAEPILRQCPKMIHFQMAHCELKSINADYFKDLSDLTFVDVSHNSITRLSPNQFYTNSKLLHLDVSHNKMDIIAGAIFRSNLKLFSLKLNNNDLKDLPQKIFHPLAELETLDLGNNKLEILSDSLFSQNKKLTTLFLDGNRIMTLNQILFSQTISMKSLILSNNSINTFDLNIISDMKNLEDLRLDNNELTEISDTFFDRNSQLLNLNLSCNLLTYVWVPVSSSVFTTFYIQGNPWKCACFNRILSPVIKLNFVDELSHSGIYPSCIVGNENSQICDQNISKEHQLKWYEYYTYYHPGVCRSRN